MPQRVDYEVLPGTRFDQYVPKLRAVLSFFETPGDHGFKAFRDHLRKLGLWDRDKSATMFSLVDLTWDKQEVRAGRLAKRLSGLHDDAAFQEALYKRLEEENVLLVKYVLEALDVESGGRLHSVHELYRMVTSYVYPGEYVTLTNFQAWMDWMAATGFIKLVGIRWALSDKGIAALPALRSLDVEEILEDLAEEGAEASEPEDEEDSAPASPPPARPPAAPAQPVRSAAGDDELDTDDDLFADLPPEPEPPSDEDMARAEADFMSRFEDVDAEAAAPPETAASRPAGPRVPLPLAAPSAAPSVVANEAEAEQLAARITGWWEAWADWPSFRAHDLGIVPTDDAEPGDALLLDLGVLALLVEGRDPSPPVFVFARRLHERGFFGALAEEGLGPALSRLGDLDGEPWARSLSERLVHAGGLARRLAAEPGLLRRVAGSKDGAEAVAVLRAQLFGGAGVEAPFWVLRALCRTGALDPERFRDATVVPTARLLRNAWRIGLVARPVAASFEELLAASRAAGAHFGPDRGWGEPLAWMDLGL